MKSFIAFLKEAESNLHAQWRPLEGDELSHEFDPQGGEIASQLKSHAKGGMQAPEVVIKAMQYLHANPNFLRAELTKDREVWDKKRIRSERVMNTSANMSWKKAKRSLEKEKVERAEKNRLGTQTSPTMLRVTEKNGTTHHWLIGGNTRLSALSKKQAALVHVIDPSRHLEK